MVAGCLPDKIAAMISGQSQPEANDRHWGGKRTLSAYRKAAQPEDRAFTYGAFCVE